MQALQIVFILLSIIASSPTMGQYYPHEVPVSHVLYKGTDIPTNAYYMLGENNFMDATISEVKGMEDRISLYFIPRFELHKYGDTLYIAATTMPGMETIWKTDPSVFGGEQKATIVRCEHQDGSLINNSLLVKLGAYRVLLFDFQLDKVHYMLLPTTDSDYTWNITYDIGKPAIMQKANEN